MYSTKKIPAPFQGKAKEPILTPEPLPLAAKEKTAPKGKTAVSPLAALLLLELFSQ